MRVQEVKCRNIKDQRESSKGKDSYGFYRGNGEVEAGELHANYLFTIQIQMRFLHSAAHWGSENGLYGYCLLRQYLTRDGFQRWMGHCLAFKLLMASVSAVLLFGR